MESYLQYNISEFVQFMNQFNENSVSVGISDSTSFPNHNLPEYQVETGEAYQKLLKHEEVVNNEGDFTLPLNVSPRIQFDRPNTADHIFDKAVAAHTIAASTHSEVKEASSYDELFDTFINSDINTLNLSNTLELQSPVSLVQPLTPRGSMVNNMNNIKAASYVFENHENYAKTLYCLDENESEVGKMCEYSNNDSGEHIHIGSLILRTTSYKEAKKISASVNQTIDDEFNFNSKYFSSIQSKSRKRKKIYQDQNKMKIRRRNNPCSDEVEWKPLSIFTVYTNIKPDAIEDTDYFENIPQSSCFGRLNMRVKRAWTRGPNKAKLI